MQRKTVTALLVFLVLLGFVYFLMRRPEKGQRTGERARPMAAIKPGSLEQISLTGKGTTVVLARGKDGWKLSKPVAYDADKYAVDSLVEKLEKLSFGDMVTEQKGRHAEYEVDDKAGIHVVAEGGGKVVADFYLGKVVDDFTMVRPAGKDQVYQAVGALRFVFEREVKNWRKRTIIDFKQDDVRKLTVDAGGAKVELAREDEKKPWKVVSSPVTIEKLDEATVNNLLSTMYSLSAFDFADGIAADKAGLDRPAARITAGLKSGGPVTLIVGSKKGDDYWVQREGAPQVFILKKYSIDNLLKRPIDFRDKTIWTFKADDVVAFTLDKKKDKESASLSLKGADWMFEGKKVKDGARIKTALEALASLKAEGFATYSAEELGLAKPDWVVEVQLKDRTRHQLTIGSVEKDGAFGVTRKGSDDIYTLRKWSLDRFTLEPKSFKQ